MSELNRDYSLCPDWNDIPEDCQNEMKNEGCIYPYYGVAPHSHNLELTGNVIGSTVINDKKEWPDNFKPDKESDSAGTYFCPYKLKCENR